MPGRLNIAIATALLATPAVVLVGFWADRSSPARRLDRPAAGLHLRGTVDGLPSASSPAGQGLREPNS